MVQCIYVGLLAHCTDRNLYWLVLKHSQFGIIQSQSFQNLFILSGERCEIPPPGLNPEVICGDVICVNGGVCAVFEVGSVSMRCACPLGYSGVACEVSLSVCLCTHPPVCLSVLWWVGGRGHLHTMYNRVLKLSAHIKENKTIYESYRNLELNRCDLVLSTPELRMFCI